MNSTTTMQFLDQMANNVHFDSHMEQSIDAQPSVVRDAIRDNKPELLKSYISNQQYYANEVKVVQL